MNMEQVVQKNENGNAASKAAEVAAKTKASKAASAAKFSERQRLIKEKTAKAAVAVEEFFSKHPDISVPLEIKDWLDAIKTTKQRTCKLSIFNIAFGGCPKVGDKITVLQCMKSTLKSKAEFDRLVKAWAEKGIVIEYQAANNILESTYTIKKM